jgi:hypothetical protein
MYTSIILLAFWKITSKLTEVREDTILCHFTAPREEQKETRNTLPLSQKCIALPVTILLELTGPTWKNS